MQRILVALLVLAATGCATRLTKPPQMDFKPRFQLPDGWDGTCKMRKRAAGDPVPRVVIETDPTARRKPPEFIVECKVTNIDAGTRGSMIFWPSDLTRPDVG